MFQVRSERTHVGVMIYADDPQLKIRLSDYTSKQDLISGIKEVPYTAGKTNTGTKRFGMHEHESLHAEFER